MNRTRRGIPFLTTATQAARSCPLPRSPSFIRRLLILLLLATLIPPTPAQPAANHDGFRPDRVLLKPKPNYHAPTLEKLHRHHGHRVVRKFEALGDLQVIQLAPGTGVAEALATYRASGLIEFVEPDYYLYPTATPNDPRYASGALWHLHNTGQNGGLPDADIDAPEAWETTHDAGSVIVAVIDTGVRYTHEDLADNMWVNPGEISGNNIDDDNNGIIDDIHGMNAVNNSGDPTDLEGHGTQVASVLGAVGNNGKGITGVAWRIQIMACRFYDDSGNGSISDGIAAIDYARLNGASIVNASFISPVFSSSFQSAINRLRSEGIILTAAAGNLSKDNDVEPQYPASYTLDNIVSVLSTTRNDVLSSFSHIGATSVDLGAPGSSIQVAYNSSDTSYVVNDGTSFSAPMVAGALALIQARYPDDSYDQIIDRLFQATDPLPSLEGKCVTGGRLNVAAALGPSLAADFLATPADGEVPLDVVFTDTSFGALSGWHWDFGDGSTSIEQNPSHRYESEGKFQVTLTVTNLTGLSSSTNQEIRAIANYAISTGSYSWIDPTGMTSIPLSNEGVSSAQSLPFPFLFYGRAYTELYVGANGLAGFVNQALNSSANHQLPNPATPNAIICPFWDDLSPASGGTVSIGTVGIAPNRRTVVSWVNVRYASNPPFSPSFQLILEEASHQIEFQYQSVLANRNAGSAGRLATVGVEDPEGLVAALYSHNGTQPLSNNQSILFTPSWAGGIIVTPSSNPTFSGNIGGPFDSESSSYTILNSSTSNLTWTATHEQPWLSLSPETGSLTPGQSMSLLLSLTPEANNLFPGDYSDAVSIENAESGRGNAIRTVHLQVGGTIGTLDVTPLSPFVATGSEGSGAISPSQTTYSLTNIGGSPITWSTGHTQSWVSLSLTDGVLAPGESVNVTASITADALMFPSGVYIDDLVFSNLTTGEGSTHRIVALTITLPPPGVLNVNPLDAFPSTGPLGGPFLPPATTYTLSHSGGAEFDWTAQTSVNWITLSSSSGSLATGQTAQVIATLNDNAGSLESGTYGATITFKNVTTGSGNTTRAVELSVDPTPFLQALPLTIPGQFQFVLVGSPDHTYTIEYLDGPDWIPVSTNTTASDGTVTVTEPILAPTRFYRARQ